MRAFLSYQMADRFIAAEIRDFFAGLNIPAFMAHDDIEVSHEWREVILKELAAADIFVALLSTNYLGSAFCMQESGIAVSRGDMTIIPLSLDGTISPGFMSTIQSRKVDPKRIDTGIILTGIAKRDVGFAVDHLIGSLKRSGNYRTSEERFRTLQPYLDRATDAQKTSILKAAVVNGQIAHAGLCATQYLPPLFATHGRYLSPEDNTELGTILARYA